MTTTVCPPRAHNLAYHCVGGVILFLNKLRHAVQGYATPRPFAGSDIDRAIAYDVSVVSGWLRHLEAYAPEHARLCGKTILELGPGPDLGTGLILLSQGARSYWALDAHNLLPAVTGAFYERLFQEIERLNGETAPIGVLRAQLVQHEQGKADRLRYVCRRDFDLAVFDGAGIDLVVSQATFEHFDDVARVIEQLSRVVSRGAMLVAQIDLTTHTRWLRERDPLNIYRYSDRLYRLTKFSGAPNRCRPFEYERLLADNGWFDIRLTPLAVVASAYLAQVGAALHKRFAHPRNQMDVLSIMVCATKR